MAPALSWSVEQVRALGVTTDVVTAGSVLGFGRTTAHRLAREGQFPCPSAGSAAGTSSRWRTCCRPFIDA